jgi:hypothetical protein
MLKAISSFYIHRNNEFRLDNSMIFHIFLSLSEISSKSVSALGIVIFPNNKSLNPYLLAFARNFSLQIGHSIDLSTERYHSFLWCSNRSFSLTYMDAVEKDKTNKWSQINVDDSQEIIRTGIHFKTCRQIYIYTYLSTS